MNRRWKSLAVIVAVMAMLPLYPAAHAAQDGEPVTLRLAGIDYDYTPAVIEAFQQQHPDITVEFAEGELSFESGQLQTTLQSGQGPDVLNVNSGPGRVGLLAASGLILPLNDFYDRTGSAEVYRPFVMDQLLAQADGTLYEVVEGIDVFQVYYNGAIFDEHGLEPPQTWDEFLGLCQSLQDAGVQPIVLGARDNYQGGWLFGNLVQASADRDVMTEVIYGDGSWTEPNIVRGAELFAQLVADGCINGLEAAALTGDQANAAFAEGQAAMMVHGQGFPIGLANDGVDTSMIRTFPLPSLNEGQPAMPTAGLAHSWVINASTQRQEAAETWLEWVASEDYLRVAIENGGALMPARNVPDDVTLPPSIRDAAQKLESGAGYNPSVYLPTAAKDAWYAAMQQILTGQVEPAAAMANIQAAMEESRQAA